MKTNEAFPARETNPVDFAKLEGYNQKLPKLLAPKWPARSTGGQANEAWALYKSNPPRFPGGIQTKPPPLETNLLEDY